MCTQTVLLIIIVRRVLLQSFSTFLLKLSLIKHNFQIPFDSSSFKRCNDCDALFDTNEKLERHRISCLADSDYKPHHVCLRPKIRTKKN